MEISKVHRITIGNREIVDSIKIRNDTVIVLRITIVYEKKRRNANDNYVCDKIIKDR